MGGGRLKEEEVLAQVPSSDTWPRLIRYFFFFFWLDIIHPKVFGSS